MANHPAPSELPTSPLVSLTNPVQIGTHDYGPMIQASMWALAAGSGIPLLVRLSCKMTKRLMWWDDYLLIAAWIFLLVNVVLVHKTVDMGYGRPLRFFTSIPSNEHLVVATKVGLCGATFAIASTGISKTSFALTMIRLTSGKTRKLVWAIIVSINFFMGVTALFIWIQCVPLQKTWDPLVPGACWDFRINRHWARFASTWSGTMDIVLAMLPCRIIWSLKLDKKEKFGIAVAMSLGVFAGMTAYIKVSRMNLDPRASGADTYDGYTLTIWSSVEPAATIVACSIPVLRVLFTKKSKTAKALEMSPTEPSTGKSERANLSESIETADQAVILCGPTDEEEAVGMARHDSSTQDSGVHRELEG